MYDRQTVQRAGSPCRPRCIGLVGLIERERRRDRYECIEYVLVSGDSLEQGLGQLAGRKFARRQAICQL